MEGVDVKGIAWVGNIYQKFEAMCLEVEEAMCQETAKYVEAQVQTVGASMKRFCSDVMQDLLPPSSFDPSKDAAAELLLNPYADFGIYKKPNANIKEGFQKHKCTPGDLDKDNSPLSKAPSTRHQVLKELPKISSICEIIGNDETTCERLALSSQTSVETVKDDSRVEDGGDELKRILSSGRCTDEDSFVASSTSRDTILVSHGDSCTSSGAQSGQSAEEIIVFHAGPGDWNAGAVGQSHYFEPNAGTVMEDLILNLEETCVLVDEDDFPPLAPKEKKKRSYKKKIKEALSLKIKSARKHEYKQLTAEYGNDDALPNSRAPELAIVPSNSDKYTVQEFPESEWELL